MYICKSTIYGYTIRVTVHSVSVTDKIPCKICFANEFLLATATFSHRLSSKC